MFLSEGLFDAIALDHHLREKKSRARYDILAAPSANTFKTAWLEHLKGRKVRLAFDNDKAGRDGQQRIAKLLREAKTECELSALQWPDGTPERYDVSDLIRDGHNVAEFLRQQCLPVALREKRIHFTRGDVIPEQEVSWLWKGHVPFGTFVSLSGLMGTQKSTVARDLAARATAGKPMPLSTHALDPFDVFYFTSEDSESRVRDIVRIHGGNLSRLHVHDIAKDNEPVDLLNCLGEIEAVAKEHGARLIIIDALNSFVGGEISTDSKARRTLSGKLQALARRTGACIIGIRNWGRQDGGSASQRSLGATSLSDVARCVMNTRELDPEEGLPRRFQLEFEKVSDAPKPDPIPYEVKDLSTGEGDSHFRRLIWRKPITAEDIHRAFGKGSAKR